MKTIKGLILLLIASLFFVSCDERDFDAPSITYPSYDGKANITIKAFIEKYQGVQDTLQIRDNDTIEGYVTANDISGNIFKQLIIQDETAAMLINIDQTNLSNDFVVGQKVVLSCRDFYIGRTYKMLQLGSYFKSGNYNQIGRADWLFVKDRIHKDGAPDPSKRLPEEITSADFAKLTDPLNVGKLYKLKGVTYVDGGKKVFANQEDVTGNAVDRIVYFTNSAANKVTTRNSTYSDFAKNMLPEGNGDLVGVLTTFNGSPQFFLRTYADVQNFSAEGSGTKEAPWSIPYALANQTGTTEGWISGYIVGCVAGGISNGNPIKDSTGIVLKAPFLNNSVILAENAGEKDWKKCVVIELPAGTDIRTQVNLVNNAANLGKKLKVTGTLNKIFGAAGLTVKTGAATEFELEGAVTSGSGVTKADPLSVANAIVKQGGADTLWVKGFVVGCVKNTVTTVTSANDVFIGVTSGFNSNTNVLIADNASETDYTKCVVVNLPAGTALRTDVNLVDNPGNIGKWLVVRGKLRAYFGIPGSRDNALAEFEFEGGGIINPDVAILEVPFDTSMGGFTESSVIGAEIWTLDATNKYVKMSGFAASANNPNEDWLISPAINLTGKASAKVKFDHAINKGTVPNMIPNHTLWISSNYTSGAPSTATWTQLTITTYPAGNNWTFVPSGEIAIPGAYLNQSNVRIAFKYLCSNTESATWEIRNLKVIE